MKHDRIINGISPKRVCCIPIAHVCKDTEVCSPAHRCFLDGASVKTGRCTVFPEDNMMDLSQGNCACHNAGLYGANRAKVL